MNRGKLDIAQQRHNLILISGAKQSNLRLNARRFEMINILSKAIKPCLLGLLTALLFLGTLSGKLNAETAKKQINTNFFGVAIKGYDTVAYFTLGQAVKGKSKFEFDWHDAKWRFASAANRDLFATDPEAYAPKYGGY